MNRDVFNTIVQKLPLLARRNPVLLGVDISSTAVKLLELKQVEDNFRVESFAIVPLSEGTIVDNVIKKPEAITEAVERAVKQSGTKLKSAAIAVPDPSVITKVIQLDAALTNEDMEALITSEADKYIPYGLDDICLDFEVIGPSPKNAKTVDVLLVASHKENVEGRVDAVTTAGLDVEIVDAETYALERACSLLLKKLAHHGDKQLVAIVDIGATTTSFTVLQNQSAVFSRTEVFGGQQLTREIQQRYSLSWEEANLAQRKGGLPDDYYSEVLNSFKEMTVINVRRCLQLFYSASQHLDIEQIFLAGGGASTISLAEYMEQQLSLPVIVANPFVDMLCAPSLNSAALAADAPALMTSCGLALRSFQLTPTETGKVSNGAN